MVDYDYLYDKEYFREALEAEHFVDKKLSYLTYRNAYLVPTNGHCASGVYTQNGLYVDHTDIVTGWGATDPLNIEQLDVENYLDETVVFLGVFYSVWGHAITDLIRRLWFLQSDDFLKKYKNCRLILIDAYNVDRYQSVYDLLEILGVKESEITMVKKLSQVRGEIVVPDECFWGEKGRCYFTSEYRDLVARVNAYQADRFLADKSCEKIYYSCVESGKLKRNVGEEKLEKFFKKQGYKIVRPEKHSLQEQLNMLANCHFFASTIGSSSHNIIFLPEHSDVILIPRAWYLTAYQTALDQVVDLNIHYVDSSLSVLAKRKAPYGGASYYYISENLYRFFGIEIVFDQKFYRKQLSDFGKYLKYAYTYDDLSERYMPEYYLRHFAYCMEQLLKSHPHRSFFWLVILCGPGRIKRTFKAAIANIVDRKGE